MLHITHRIRAILVAIVLVLALAAPHVAAPLVGTVAVVHADPGHNGCC